MLRRICCLLLFAVATVTQAQTPPETLNFGIISTESSSNLRALWQPVLDDLAQAVGIPVRPFFASDYAGVIEAMRFNKVHLAWYGNKSAMEAVDRAQGEVFVSSIDKDGNPGYWSVLLVRKDSPYQTVEDIIRNAKDLRFGTGDPNSTSGNLIPGYYLWNAHQVDPNKIFKAVRIANHETNLLSVMNGQVDVAVNNTESMTRYHNNTGRDPKENVRIIWTSPLIPADPLVWRSDLPPALKEKIRTFFLTYGQAPEATRERQNLLAIDYQGFRMADNRHLLPIRQLELARQRTRVQTDERLNEAERSQRLAELDRQLAALQQQVDAMTQQ